MKQYGLIFDMDNTILDTHIDFKEMHRRTADSARRFGREEKGLEVPDFSAWAVAEIIKWAVEQGISQQKVDALWQTVAEVEADGMRDIVKEQGVEAALDRLAAAGNYLVVLTNNSLRAARLAMENSGLMPYFQEVHARDEYQELKPSPKGILSIMAENPQVDAWLMLGDSWLDGQAALRAGIPFAAYGSLSAEYWREHQLRPNLFLRNWDQAKPELLRRVMDEAAR